MSLVKEAGHRAGPLAETPVSLGAGTAKRIRPAGGRRPPGSGKESSEEKPSCREAEHLLSRALRPSAHPSQQAGEGLLPAQPVHTSGFPPGRV